MWDYENIIDVSGPNHNGKWEARVSLTSAEGSRTEALYFESNPMEARIDLAATKLIETLNAILIEQAETQVKNDSLDSDVRDLPVYMESLRVTLEVAKLLIRAGQKELAVQVAEIAEPVFGLTKAQRDNFNAGKAKLINKLSSF